MGDRRRRSYNDTKKEMEDRNWLTCRFRAQYDVEDFVDEWAAKVKDAKDTMAASVRSQARPPVCYPGFTL